MPILPIITEPDPCLRKISSKVEKIDEQLQDFMLSMRDTLKNKGELGLAAIQVARPARIIVIDLSLIENEIEGVPRDFYPFLYLVNPEILEKSEEQNSMREGCLSLPGQVVNMDRAKKITIKFLDFNAKEHIITTDTFFARVVQHEMDHLNGVLMIDYLSKFKKDIALRKLRKIKKNI